MKLKNIFFIICLSTSCLCATELSPITQRGENIFLTADFLYWMAQLEGLAFARSTTTKKVSGDWSPGFKVGIGSILPHDQWQVFFEYSRIHNHTIKHAGASFYPLWNVGGLLGSAPNSFTTSSSYALWKQTFNSLDITLGKHFVPSSCTLFFPFLGLKGIYYHQYYNVGYHNVSPGGFLTSSSHLLMTTRQRCWGVGILGGFNSEWLLIHDLRLFGDLAIAAVSSHFNNSRKDFLNYINTPTNQITVANAASHCYTVKMMLDFALGFKTDLWFKEDRYHFSMQLGWEMQLWLHQNQTIVLLDPSHNQGNLFFQGLTFKTRFDF